MIGRAALSIVMTVMLGASAQGQISSFIIAHRGASHDAPENTLAAFQLAWEQGADAIEGDFRLAADGRIVCLHDVDTKRVAGVNHAVAETRLDELRALDVGRWKDPRFAGERPPTLAEVLATLPPGRRFFVELKTGPEIVPPLVAELAAWEGDLAALTFIAFDADTIAACKRALPEARAHWLTGFEEDESTDAWRPAAQEIAATVATCGADGVGLEGERRVIDRDFIGRLVAGGVGEFHVWTIDAPADARFFRDLGAVGITTNRPAFLRTALEDHAP